MLRNGEVRAAQLSSWWLRLGVQVVSWPAARRRAGARRGRNRVTSRWSAVAGRLLGVATGRAGGVAEIRVGMATAFVSDVAAVWYFGEVAHDVRDLQQSVTDTPRVDGDIAGPGVLPWCAGSLPGSSRVMPGRGCR